MKHTDTTVSAYEGGWLQTLTGLPFSPMAPHPDEISIADIAGALSKLCRYGGHCIQFYSVAEHCVLMAEMMPEPLRLAALMHDASEAYLVDVPRPLKKFLGGYYEAEDRLMRAVADKYGFAWPMPDEVKRADHAMLSDERAQNMAPMRVVPEIWGNEVPALGVTLEYWDPHTAALEFVRAFHRYGGRCD